MLAILFTLNLPSHRFSFSCFISCNFPPFIPLVSDNHPLSPIYPLSPLVFPAFPLFSTFFFTLLSPAFLPVYPLFPSLPLLFISFPLLFLSFPLSSPLFPQKFFPRRQEAPSRPNSSLCCCTKRQPKDPQKHRCQSTLWPRGQPFVTWCNQIHESANLLFASSGMKNTYAENEITPYARQAVY